VKPQVELDVAAGEVRLFRTGSKRLVFWRSLLMLTPRWEDGPWIKLLPLPAVERSEIPIGRVTSALSGGSVPTSTSNVGFRSVPESTADIPDFRQVLRGYNVSDVDRFLRDVTTRLQSGAGVSASELRAVTFRTSVRGYDMDEVDAYIEALARDD
jgi:DivIVA domain-containing protein